MADAPLRALETARETSAGPRASRRAGFVVSACASSSLRAGQWRIITHVKRPTAEHRAPRLVRTPKPPATTAAPKAFDSDAARQAWRQVARTRGSTSLGQERPRSFAWGWAILLGLGLIAFVVVERTRRPATKAPDAVAAAESAKVPTARIASSPEPPAPTGLRTPGYGTVPEPAPSLDTVGTTDSTPVKTPSLPKGIGVIATAPPMPRGDAEPPTVAATLSKDVKPDREPRRPRPDRPRRVTPDEPEQVMPAALPWRRRNAPAGTGDEYAKAFKKIPKARDDKPPVGGIAASGLHVDRVNMGTKYARGRCGGETRHFRLRDDDYANVCFRVVHLRESEKVLVRWELNGKLVRRTWVPIPPAHAYRTRAGLRLQPSYRGNWQVRVMSRDGVELATQVFRVD